MCCVWGCFFLCFFCFFWGGVQAPVELAAPASLSAMMERTISPQEVSTPLPDHCIVGIKHRILVYLWRRAETSENPASALRYFHRHFDECVPSLPTTSSDHPVRTRRESMWDSLGSWGYQACVRLSERWGIDRAAASLSTGDVYCGWSGITPRCVPAFAWFFFRGRPRPTVTTYIL